MNPQLYAALKARDESQAEIHAIDLRIAKLSALAQSASPAVSELNALHSDHQVRLAQYAESADGTPPVIDADRVARLKAEIAAHTDSTNSANTAIASLQAQRQRHVATVKTASAAATFHAVVEIAETSVGPIVSEINIAWLTLAAAKGKLDSMRHWLLGEARRLDENGLFSVAERLQNKANEEVRQPAAFIDETPFASLLNEKLSPASAKEAA